MNVARQIEPITLEEFEIMPKNEHLTYELIDSIVMMSPSPSREHQSLSFRLQGILFSLLKDTTCQGACELDIRMQNDIFKPDILIFCDQNTDLPEIVFEILSPSTRRRDLTIKTIKYEEAGIKEYWIIDPKTRSITVHNYVDQTVEIYIVGDIAHSQARPEIAIAIADVFA